MNSKSAADSENLSSAESVMNGEERKACVGLDPKGFFIRRPPPPNLLEPFITPDKDLFQTIHMGAAVVDTEKFVVIIDGLVNRPLTISLAQLKRFPSRTITAFHECYGSPLKPPTENTWRIGNVKWTGVPLNTLLDLSQPSSTAKFVWSEGLDYGEFGGMQADRYQKDLPISKARSQEVMLAYEMNGKPLSRERGGPVRLIVPGWFGTNSTKWLCRLSLQSHRAQGIFTTKFYNERNPLDPTEGMGPVWGVEPNSMIVKPAPDDRLQGSTFEVSGWAWSNEDITAVHLNLDDGDEWIEAGVNSRTDFSWQAFTKVITLSPGPHRIIARATSSNGIQQPISGRRNHVHTLNFHLCG
jgi:DMSO/TMAO reductase YedYZ molybdopterin-dependent catalytic subunit